MDALTFEMILVLAILAGAIILFVTEIVRIDVAAIIIMVVVGLTGLVGPKELFDGFASNAVISIIAVMILGAGLDRVGVMRKVAAFLLKIGGRTESRIVVMISSAVAGISAFMQNIGAAALFLPVTERLAERTGIPVSRMLMPMGFAAILGGTITLVASGPLILLNDLLASTSKNLGVEIEPLGLFTPTPIGLALSAAGIAMFAIAGRWLLPANKKEGAEKEARNVAKTYGLNEEIHPYIVAENSPLVGQTVEAIEAQLHGVLMPAAHDREGLRVAPAREYVVEAGVTLGLVGSKEDIQTFVVANQLTPSTSEPFKLLDDQEYAGLAEIVVRPGSDIIGQQVRDLRLRKAHNVTLLAIYRGGETMTGDLRQHVLKASDVLVVFSPWENLRALTTNSSDFVAISNFPATIARTHKQSWALAAFGLALILVIFSGMQLSLALMVGVVILLVSKTLTIDEAYKSVSWKTVFLLAALIPLGQAVETTGTAAWIAEGVVGAAGGLPIWGLQFVIALLATVFSLTISNVGATVLLVPLAANVAVGVGADPAQFGLIVAIAVSNAFLLPTHQVNALLMGPGNYRVADYLRAGSAMSLVFLIVLIASVNIFM